MAVREFLEQKIREAFPYEPTPCQDELFSRLPAFLTGEGDIMIVNGYAGTGKTEAMGAAVRAMKALNLRFRLMAPTGRAAKVLQRCWRATPARRPLRFTSRSTVRNRWMPAEENLSWT